MDGLTINEIRIANLPEKMEKENREIRTGSLNDFLKKAFEFIILRPYENGNYITIFKTDRRINNGKHLLKMLEESFGDLQAIDIYEERCDIWIDKKVFSVFDAAPFTVHVKELRNSNGKQ
jgi:hypothetical protein